MKHLGANRLFRDSNESLEARMFFGLRYAYQSV